MERRVDPSILMYPIIMVLVYAMSRYPLFSQYLGDFIASVEVLLLFLLLSIFAKMLPWYGEVASTLVKGTGFALAFYLLPSEPYTSWEFQLPLALLTMGITVASVASGLPDVPALVTWGIGSGMVFYGLYLFSQNLVKGYILAPALLYAAVASVVVYSLAALERSGLTGSRFLERNASGVVLLFAILGLYLGLREYILQMYPDYEFYLRWAAIGTATLLAAVAVQSHLSAASLENYLVGEWNRHSMEFSMIRDKEFERVKKAMEEFVLRKKKSELVLLLTYYGIKAFGDIEMVREITEPIIEYRDEGYSIFTPSWWVRKKEREQMERRINLVNSALQKIEEYMGGKR
jgi:hypothetical protein